MLKPFNFLKILQLNKKINLLTSINANYYHKYQNNNLNVLFFGTDNFSLPSLKILHKHLKSNNIIKELGVVTSFKSHSNPVKQFAEKENLKIFNYPMREDFNHNYDLGVVVSFGYMIPKTLIDSFSLGMINVHASLLPRWRGAAPIIYSILHGDESTGVTIMKVKPHHFDVGEILLQKDLEIEKNVFLPQLHEKLSRVGAETLEICICDINKYLENAKPQSSENVTYAPKIEKSLHHIDWSKMTAKYIYNLYRALYSYKFLTTNFHTHTCKIIKLEKFENQNLILKQSGAIKYLKNDKSLVVQCSDNNFIKIYALQVEGKKIINAQDFNNGFLKKKLQNEHYFN